MLSVSLFFLSKSIISKHQNLYKNLSILFISFSLLTKESFVLFIPSIILMHLFFFSRIFNVSYQTAIRKNYLFMSILFILFILPVIFIFRNIGTDAIGYAGVSNNYFSLYFIKWTIVQFYKNIYFVIIIFGFFLLIQNAPVSNVIGFNKKCT